MPLLPADFSHARPCKPFCENSLTLPSAIPSISIAEGRSGSSAREAQKERHAISVSFFLEHRNTIDARPQSVGYLYNAIFQQLQSYRKAYYFDTIHLKNMCYHP